VNQLLQTEIGGVGLLTIIAGLLLVYELGFRLGRRRRDSAVDARRSQADILIAALLGLLGLLLAFSFGIVEERFEKRKALVLDDANTIGTTYLRAKLLPSPHDQRVEALLREYVEDRTNINTPEGLQRGLARAPGLQRKLWSEATIVARANPDSEVVGRFVEALNNMIDLHESRVTVGLIQHMPWANIWLLVLVSALSVGMVGFRSGLAGTRSAIPAAMLVIAITAVLALIIDLDRPYSCAFPVSQRPMEDLLETISQDVTAPDSSPRTRPSASSASSSRSAPGLPPPPRSPSTRRASTWGDVQSAAPSR
jgi:hypothetical protein